MQLKIQRKAISSKKIGAGTMPTWEFLLKGGLGRSLSGGHLLRIKKMRK